MKNLYLILIVALAGLVCYQNYERSQMYSKQSAYDLSEATFRAGLRHKGTVFKIAFTTWSDSLGVDEVLFDKINKYADSVSRSKVMPTLKKGLLDGE